MTRLMSEDLFAIHAPGLAPHSYTASTTQSLAGATPISGMALVNAVNAGDAIGLPQAVAGEWCAVDIVASTAAPTIYPGLSTDKIDGGTAGAGVSLTVAHRGFFFMCFVTGNWVSSQFGVAAG